MPGCNIEWEKWKQYSAKLELANNYNLKKEEQDNILTTGVINTIDENVTTFANNSIEFASINPFLTKEELNIGNINHLLKQSDFKHITEEGCDTIFLKNGLQVKAKVLEVGQSEIKYKLCDNLNGPTFSMNKFEVVKIKYYIETSTIALYNKAIPQRTSSVAEKKQEPSSLVGFISGVTGILLFPTVVAPLILGFVALIASLTGLEKINKNPEKWKSKGLANAGLILGVINMILSVSLLAFSLISLSSIF